MIIHKAGDIINDRELINTNKKGKWYSKCIMCCKVTLQPAFILRNRNCPCSKWVENLPRDKHYLYRVLYNIIQRCYNVDHYCYHRYGGRGIGVCKRWEDRNGDPFRNFVEDIHKEIGLRPNMNASRNGDYKIGGWHRQYHLGRLDHSKDYGPGNVEWCTIEENVAEMNSRYVEVTCDGALDRFYVNLGWG